jgi:hypothetical protein
MSISQNPIPNQSFDEFKAKFMADREKVQADRKTQLDALNNSPAVRFSGRQYVYSPTDPNQLIAVELPKQEKIDTDLIDTDEGQVLINTQTGERIKTFPKKSDKKLETTVNQALGVLGSTVKYGNNGEVTFVDTSGDTPIEKTREEAAYELQGITGQTYQEALDTIYQNFKDRKKEQSSRASSPRIGAIDRINRFFHLG